MYNSVWGFYGAGFLWRATIGVFTSTGVTGYKGIRVTFCNVFKWRKVTLLPCYRVTPVLVNTPNMVQWCEEFFCSLEFLVALIRAVFKLTVSNATNYYIYIKSMLETIPVTWSMIGS